MTLLIKIEKNTKDYDHFFLTNENKVLTNEKDISKIDKNKNKDKEKNNDKSKKVHTEKSNSINNNTNNNFKFSEKENPQIDIYSRNINDNNNKIINDNLNFETISIFPSKQNNERSVTNISISPQDRLLSLCNNFDINKENQLKINLKNNIINLQTFQNSDIKSKVDFNLDLNTNSNINNDNKNYKFNKDDFKDKKNIEKARETNSQCILKLKLYKINNNSI
jgi:hypothetical protein